MTAGENTSACYLQNRLSSVNHTVLDQMTRNLLFSLEPTLDHVKEAISQTSSGSASGMLQIFIVYENKMAELVTPETFDVILTSI